MWPFGRKKKNNLRVEYDTIPEARAAIQVFRQRKKELQILKREAGAVKTSINVERRSKVASQGRLWGGRGGINRTIRGGQRAGRRADRQVHAKKMAVIDEHRVNIERDIASCDRAILEIERWINAQQAKETRSGKK